MTFEIALLLSLIVLAVVLFALDWIPADVISLGLLLTLVLTGLLPTQKAFAGFGSDVVILILGLLILTAALLKTGVMELVGRVLARYAGKRPAILLGVIMLSAAGLSAFVSNTACTAFFLPIVVGVAERAKISPSKFLLPLAFCSILSSSVTLISTSSNLVISGLMTSAGMRAMDMFELAPVGIPIVIVGLLYMFLVGRRLIPHRAAPTELLESFGVRPYLTEILILPNSPLVGKTLEESGLGREFDFNVLRVVREKDQHLFPSPGLILQAQDVILVEGVREEILKIKDKSGIEIKADVKLSDPGLRSEDAALIEAIVLPHSQLIGRSLKRTKFRQRYGLQVLALNRHGRNVLQKISQVPLRMGDVLLIQGRKSNIAALEDDGAFRILGAVEENRFDRRKALLAVGIFVGALTLGVLKVVSLPIAALMGAFFAFVSRCISPEDAYREVDWRVIILIACMLSVGVTMESTGAAKYLAGLVVNWSGGIGPVGLLGGFFFLSVLLTQPMSNQAAAAVILPIAVQTALQLELNPRPFAMMVAVAASCSYLTPLEPSCLMVYGPGRYRFMDFLKVGSPLTALIFIVAILIVPRVWPLK
jgi:di/tricarboxylate transporter